MKHAFTLTAVSLLSSHIAYANPSHEPNIEVKSNVFRPTRLLPPKSRSAICYSGYFDQRRCGAPRARRAVDAR